MMGRSITKRLLETLREEIALASSLDIIISFIRFSGVILLLDDLKKAIARGTKIRLLTTTYLGITEPYALTVLRNELTSSLDMRLFNDKTKSFHPKAFFFDDKMILGSSNLSESALTDGVEWNYMIVEDQDSIRAFHNEFEMLFSSAVPCNEETIADYAKSRRPYRTIETERNEITANEVQLEALYALKRTREEGADKALIYAATGIGKTYLAVFDSLPYSKVLFVAHREEILHQAQRTFLNVRPRSKTGFFTGSRKDSSVDILFASVASLENHLGEFDNNRFDYIIVDEFHHAAARSYRAILNYFTPRFLLGLTATAERMDRQSIYSLCDYNVPYHITLSDAINRGILVPFHYYGIYDDTVDYSEVHSIGGKYVVRDLTNNLEKDTRVELIYKNYIKYFSSRALGFTSSREHAIWMAEKFSLMGIPSVAVVSGESGSIYQMKRDEAVRKLEKEEIKVIFTVDIFNEGIDIPSIDLIMFLRPTESPVIFLQQLGRGLRKNKGKEYLNVLDFIGNYNTAFLVPNLLTKNVETTNAEMFAVIPCKNELPYGCIADFDLRLIDLFKIMREKKISLKERIRKIYARIRKDLGHTLSRTEFFENSTGEELEMMFSTASPFRDYLAFLEEQGENIPILTEVEKKLINTVERTAMTKSYKIPILLAFISEHRIKNKLTDEDVIKAFRDFYSSGITYMDMEKDKSTKNFAQWNDKKILHLAKENPIRYLVSSAPDLFIPQDNVLKLTSSLSPYLEDQNLLKEFSDAINLRKLEYFWKRFRKSGSTN